jgi:hypothetical protein
MREQELRDRMSNSVDAYLTGAVVDPAADVIRGRKHLVRRRAVAGLGAVAAVVLLGLGVQTLVVSAPPSYQPITQSTDYRTPADREAEKTSARWITTVDRHVDPGRSFTSGKPTSWGIGTLDKRGRTLVGDLMTSDSWKEGAGIGQVWVSVSRPEYAQPKSELCGPKRSNGFMPYVCSDAVAPDGRPIVTGVALMTVKSFDGAEHRDVPGYFVRYVRPDGQIVMVGVDGVDMVYRYDNLPNPPVPRPQVTMAQLIAAATDPALSLS